MSFHHSITIKIVNCSQKSKLFFYTCYQSVHAHSKIQSICALLIGYIVSNRTCNNDVELIACVLSYFILLSCPRMILMTQWRPVRPCRSSIEGKFHISNIYSNEYIYTVYDHLIGLLPRAGRNFKSTL